MRRTGEGNSVAAKVAIVILADTETRADRAKVANALTTAYEFKEAGEVVTVVFTGPGPDGSPSSPTRITGHTGPSSS